MQLIPSPSGTCSIERPVANNVLTLDAIDDRAVAWYVVRNPDRLARGTADRVSRAGRPGRDGDMRTEKSRDSSWSRPGRRVCYRAFRSSPPAPPEAPVGRPRR